MTREEAALESTIARWIAARPAGHALASLVGDAAVRVVGVRRVASTAHGRHPDPHAAIAELRLDGAAIAIAGSSHAVRAIAQRVLGGPPELAAPRPLTAADHAIWALVVAAAIDDAGIPGEVWPLAPEAAPASDAIVVELAATLGDLRMTVIARCPPGLELRAAPPRAYPRWRLALPIVVARAAVARSAIEALRPGDAVTVDPVGARGRTTELELVVGRGGVRLQAAPGTLEAAVLTGYVRRDMALPDDAHLELTVELGSTHLTVRQLAELAIGQIIPLRRPLAGPYDVRAGGQLVGQGELIDIDGELGVRIVALTSASPEIAQE